MPRVKVSLARKTQHSERFEVDPATWSKDVDQRRGLANSLRVEGGVLRFRAGSLRRKISELEFWTENNCGDACWNGLL